MRRSAVPALRPVAPLLAVLLGGLLAACSTARTLTLQSDPPGATVWVNGRARGRAPVTVPFTYYGYFDVRMEKTGYQSLQTEVAVPTQPDGIPFVDLPSELTVHRRSFSWVGHLEPDAPAGKTDAALKGLLEEARAFRQRTLEEARPGPGEAAPGAPSPRPTPSR